MTIDRSGTSASSKASATVLSQRQLNRALLARQLLLDRARLRLPEMLDGIAGLQAQYAPSMYVGTWSRLEGFERDDLTRALEERTVVQGTLLRSTIHLVSARDYWDHARAGRQARQTAWLRANRKELTAEGVAAAARRLRERLRDGPLRRAELEELVGKRQAAAAGAWIDLVRAPPSGTWERRRADLYAAAEDWLGEPPATTEEEALGRLVPRYLRAFGPSTPGEIASWAGVLIGHVTPLLGGMELRRFRADDGQELLDVLDAPLPDPDTPAPVRFLPTWDATLLVHARRTGILSEEHRPLIFNTKIPQSLPTFLVDGTVAGTWRYEKGHVRLDPFAPLDASARREAEEEAERLAAFHA